MAPRRRSCNRNVRFLLPCCLVGLLASSLPSPVRAATPTATIEIYALDQFDYAIHASGASFGSSLPFGRDDQQPALTLALPPEDDPLLCNEADGTANYLTAGDDGGYNVYGGDTAILVPRGDCSFERKALSAQRLGAAMVIVRNTLDSRYRLNETDTETGNSTNSTAAGDGTTNGSATNGSNNSNSSSSSSADSEPTYDDILWPTAKHDYDCPSGRAILPKSVFSFDPLPYDAATNDPLLTGTASSGNLCAIASGPDFEKGCPSLRCLLTGKEESSDVDADADADDETMMQACCAWDLHLDMGPDGSLSNSEQEEVTVPALFITMEQGSSLFDTMNDFAGTTTIIAYQRWYPIPNASTFLLWMLGTFVTWIACYLSASEYRKTRKRIVKAMDAGRAIFQGSAHRGAADAATAATTGQGGGVAEDDVEAGRSARADASSSAAEAIDEHVVAERDDGVERQTVVPRQQQVHEGAFEDEPLDRDFSASNRPATIGPPSDAALHLPEESESARDPPPTGFNAVPIARRDPQQQEMEQQEQQPPPQPQPQEEQAQQTSPTPPPPARQQQQQQQQEAPPTLDLNLYHVAGFLIFASGALFILFYFKIYRAVTVLYGIGCSGAMAQVIFYPLYFRSARKVGALHIIQSSILPKKATACGLNTITWLEMVSVASAYAIGMSWLYVFFTWDDPHTNTFYWITQDVMGAAVCVAFLGVIRLNSIKIATILLVAVFIYDIFFVFITPLITKEGDSVMVTVATSGGAPADPDYCEKYPDEGDCRGGDPLPMLLVMPRVNDYRGGTSLLGLGDIVLPGLLISFAARLDSAKRLLQLCTDAYFAETGGARRQQRRGTGSTVASFADDLPDSTSSTEQESITRCGRVQEFFCGGYYLTPLIIAYAIGLGCANLAVYLMEKGQPALLYLVPACLGTMIVLGWMRGELGELWSGSERIKKCDRVVASVRSSASNS